MVAFVAGDVLAAADLNSAFNNIAINTQSGAAYTLALTDAGGLVALTASSGTATVTVPTNASVAFATGAQIGILAAGGTATTYQVSPAGGVTVTSTNSLTKLAGNAALAVLVKTGTNTWYLAGGLSA